MTSMKSGEMMTSAMTKMQATCTQRNEPIAVRSRFASVASAGIARSDIVAPQKLALYERDEQDDHEEDDRNGRSISKFLLLEARAHHVMHDSLRAAFRPTLGEDRDLGIELE